jgi:ParB family chromosome partitioning protein
MTTTTDLDARTDDGTATPTGKPARGVPGPAAGEYGVDAAGGRGVPVPLVFVDPRTLLVDINVRTEARLDKQFVGSIRDLGVLVPVTARWVEGERLRVLTGQRRVLGAIEAGRDRVPVYLVQAPDDQTAAEIARIIEQLTENDHRAGLRDGDRVRAYQQLTLLGLSAGQIARRTRAGTAAVKTSLAVGGSRLALGALDQFDLTLAQAAVLAEFDGDADAVKALTVAAAKDPDQFDHIAQRLRDAQAEATAREALTTQLTSAGVSLIDPPVYGERRVRRLDRLKASADDCGTEEISVRSHADCPGHAAYLDDRGRYTGAVEIVPVYVCTDPARYGHADRYADTLATGRAAGPMTEEQKAERRHVIANNKAWDSAQTVRRTWLKTFLARTSPPKDAQQYIVTTLATASHEVRAAMTDGHALALQLLGLGQWQAYGGRPHPVTAAAAKATSGRTAVLTLGLLLGGLEQSLGRHTWRNPSRAAVAYLTALSRWGYSLSDVERLVADPDTDESAAPPSPPDGESAAAAADCPYETVVADTGGLDAAAGLRVVTDRGSAA